MLSIESQRLELEKYALREHLTIVGIKEEVAVADVGALVLGSERSIAVIRC